MTTPSAEIYTRNGATPSGGSVQEQIHIPVADPDEALRFCQTLAQQLATASPVEEHWHGAASPSKNGHSNPTPVFSIVLPVYNEMNNIRPLHARLTTVLASLQEPYEIIFVDDGSRDGSTSRLHEISANDENVTIIELSRNFGHQVAISAGLDYSSGEAVIIMDSDLQDPPEILTTFIEKWQDGYDVVYAVRTERKEHWLKRAAYASFYRLLKHVASIEIPLDAGDFCIMDRRVVDLLIGMPERTRFVRGIRSWIGLKQIGIPYERHARHAGKPKYTFRRLLYLALDGLVSFSYVPLRIITVMGFGVSFLALVLATFYAIKKLTVGLSPPGFATIVVAIFFLAGIQLITIGVIGEYVGRIFEEVKRRPLYVVRRVSRQ